MVKYETGDDRFQSYACIEENDKIVLLSPYIFSYSSASECRFYDIDSDGIDEFICSSECLDGYDSAKTDSTIRIFKKDKRDIYILDYNYRVRYINLNNTDYDRFYSYLVGDFKDNKICINIGIHDKTSPASAYYNKSKNQWSVMELEKTDMYLTYKDGKYIIENQKDIEIIEESDKMIEY